ncbi:MAG: hypothetical protein L6V93_07495 [Clostridiales bacterium]|nr:MAG: hypothetical protein L6V93_07495 [Clostridiales bacterium]
MRKFNLISAPIAQNFKRKMTNRLWRINALRTEAKDAWKMCALIFDCSEDEIFFRF